EFLLPLRVHQCSRTSDCLLIASVIVWCFPKHMGQQKISEVRQERRKWNDLRCPQGSHLLHSVRHRFGSTSVPTCNHDSGTRISRDRSFRGLDGNPLPPCAPQCRVVIAKHNRRDRASHTPTETASAKYDN